MAKNLIFTTATYHSLKARHKNGRVELMAKDVAAELNTYKNFGVFKSNGDTFVDQDSTGKRLTQGTDGKPDHPGTPGVRSLFNKYSAVLTGASDGSWENKGMDSVIKELVYKASNWRISNNAPLLDTPENRKAMRAHSGCSVRELVQASQKGYFGRATYSYADFMYCKYLGRVPNNHLITLRRYPVPVSDNITPIGTGGFRKDQRGSFAPIGTMVTWLGTPGNDMKSILKYNYSMPFAEINADWNSVEKRGGQTGMLNGLEALSNKTARQMMAGGDQVDALQQNFNKFFAVGSGFPLQDMTDVETNKVYGPIDRVKSSYQRGKDGLQHKQSFSLTFEYELKAYNGINPKQAMLDLLASILSVTYTTGSFWGGGYKGAFITQSSTFSNLPIFKCNGGFTDFMDAFMNSTSGITQMFKDGFDIKEEDSTWTTIKKMLNSIGGALMGGLLNTAGRPARYFTNSLISEAPVGLWHITIGNPHHPIMSLGNMILKDTTIEHSGPLGLDDFPTHLTVTCSFDRGKPRDQRGIEAIYMTGNDRIFHSMEGGLAHMYNVATAYKHEGNKQFRVSQDTTRIIQQSELVKPSDSGRKTVEKTGNGEAFVDNASRSLKGINNVQVLNYYFGDMDNYAILSSSREQGHGMSKKTPEESTLPKGISAD